MLKKRTVSTRSLQTVSVSAICVKKTLAIYLFYYLYLCYFFTNSLGKQGKMLNKLNILCYSYQVKKLFYQMNGVGVLTVIESAVRSDCAPTTILEPAPTGTKFSAEICHWMS